MTPIARTSAALPLMLALACAAGPARATQRVQFGSPESPLHLEFAGEYRFQGTMFTDIPVTADGVGIDQPYVADQRLRGRFDISGRHFRVGTEWDLFSGQMFGPTWGIPGDVDERNRHARTIFQRDGFVPRRAAATFSWPAFTLEMGLVTSHWGLGMLANDGAHAPLFGRNDFGARVVRLSRGALGPFWFPGFPPPDGVPSDLGRGLILHQTVEVVGQDVRTSAHRDPLVPADPDERPPAGAGIYRERRLAVSAGLLGPVRAWADSRGTDVPVVPLNPGRPG